MSGKVAGRSFGKFQVGETIEIMESGRAAGIEFNALIPNRIDFSQSNAIDDLKQGREQQRS